MNNTFTIKRFALYARKHYWECRKSYIILLIVVIIATLAMTIEGIFPHLGNYPDKYIALLHTQSKFNQAFFIIGTITIYGVLSISALGGKREYLAVNSITLPISFQERFWFTILNTIVIAPIVYSLIFLAITSYVETLYLFGDGGMRLFTGIINRDISLPSEMLVGDIKNENIFSFANLINTQSTEGSFYGKYLFLIFGYIYFISVMIWSSFSFIKHRYSKLIIIVSHLLLGLVVIIGIKYIGSAIFKDIPITSHHDDFIVSCNLFDTDYISLYFTLTLFMLSQVYIFVAWKKLKNIEITE